MQPSTREFNRKSHGLLPVTLLFLFVFLSPGLLRSQVGRAWLYPYPHLDNQQIVRWDQPPLKPWRVTAHAGDPIRIDIFVEAWPKNAYPGIGLNPDGPETVTMPISLDTNVIHNISVTTSFALIPDSTIDSIGKAQFDSIRGVFSNGRLIVTSFGKSYFAVQGWVCRLTCTANLALGEHTTISLGPCPTTLNDTPYFVADSLPSVVNIIALGGCGDSILLRYMAGQSLFRIVSIRPNPASGQLEVRVVGADSGILSVRMYDALGRVVIPMQDVRGKSLPYAVTLDVSSLPEGIYFLQLFSTGLVQTRSISIER